MNIKFAPLDENHPADLKAHTNIGEFAPGEVRQLRSDEEKRHGEQLVANGDFAWTEEPQTSGNNPPVWPPAKSSKSLKK